MHAAALRAVTQLDVADHLVDGPRDATELAKLTGTHAPFLRRLLRFTATRGIFHEDEDGRFHQTQYSDVLRADARKTIRAAVLGMTAHFVWLPSGGDLTEAVRTGEPAFERRFGQPFFTYLIEHPDDGALFNEGIANLTAGEYDLITASYDFPHDGVVVDVGGGRGALLLAVLRTHPDLRGVLLDHEMVLADHVLGQLNADDRWTAVAGDFFEAVPPGDLYLVKNVLHDWSDDQCVRILENCRLAMRPDGTIIVIDAVVPSGNAPHYGKLQDMFMMLSLTGQERTRPEFENLLARAGLRITRVVPTGSPYSLIEAAPAD
jgi:hypothetical protein